MATNRDIADVRRHIGTGGPTDNMVEDAITEYGSVTAAAQYFLELRLATLRSQSTRASVEGLSYDNSDLIAHVQEQLSTVYADQGMLTGSITLYRDDIADRL